MAASVIKNSFAAGELTPSLWGRTDLAKFQIGASVMRNMFVNYRGGASSRAGLGFVGQCRQPATALPPRIIPFRFSIFQNYILEFGDQYMRVVANGAYVTEASFPITNVTQANPGQATIPGNNYAAVDWLFLDGFADGMTELNGRTAVVRSVAGNIVALNDTFGNPITTLNFPAYSSGGIAARIFTLPTPYAAVDLPYLKFTQSADVMSLCLVNQQTGTEYATQELTRLAANSWTIAPPAIATSIDAPSGVTAVASTSGSTAYGYVVTAVDDATGEESVASAIAAVTSAVDIAATFGTISLSWTTVAGVSGYNIYRATPDYTNTGNFVGQLFGYAGSTAGATTWKDTNVIPDFTTTPPKHLNPFSNGAVLNVAVTAPGSGYAQNTTTATMVSATGSGAILRPVVIGGSIASIVVENGGENYQPTDLVLISGQSPGTGAAATAPASPVGTDGTSFFGGSLGPATISNGGSHYINPTVTAPVPPAGGVRATFVATVSQGVIVNIYPNNPGTLYASTQTLTITDAASAGTGAAASATIGPLTGNAPAEVAYFQQRRGYFGSLNNPDGYHLSQPGAYTNFDSADPPIDSDAISGNPWAQQVNGIQSVTPMPGGLLVGTGLEAWQLSGTGGAGSPITPSQQSATPQDSYGFSATLPMIRVGSHVLYVPQSGTSVQDMEYNFWNNMYAGTDISILSSHLFVDYQFTSWASARQPYKIVWMVRDDGRLLSLTYMKEQEVNGFGRHDTNGLFQSVAVVTEPPVDAPYFVVKRYIAGAMQWAYYLERMDNRQWQAVEDCFCVDAGVALPQPTPNATLSASAAMPTYGALPGPVILGGSNYSAGVQGFIQDPTGSGAVIDSVTVVAGSITDYTINPAGAGYSKPVVVFTDATGSGASAQVLVDQSVAFTASAAVFDNDSIGSVIRMGGGVATVAQVVSPTLAKATMTSPITATVPNDPNNLPVPAASGEWTLTQPVQTLSGLDHLDGMLVTGLADGAVIPPTVVNAGSITLSQAASSVVAGLAFTAQLQSMHTDLGSGETVQGRAVLITGVTARIEGSRDFSIGQDRPIASAEPNQAEYPWTDLAAVQSRSPPPPSQGPVPLFTGDRYVTVRGNWNLDNRTPNGRVPMPGEAPRAPGMVACEQSNPLPLNILALIPQIVLGDSGDKMDLA